MSALTDRCPPGYTDLIYGYAPSPFLPVGDYCFGPKGSGLKPVAARLPFSGSSEVPQVTAKPLTSTQLDQITGQSEHSQDPGYVTPTPQTNTPNPQAPLPIQPPLNGGSMPYGLQPYTGGYAYAGTGVTGVNIGPGGITGTGTVFGVPVTATIPLPGGPDAPAPAAPSSPGLVAPTTTNSGECPGLMSVKDPITGKCIDLTALPPGGDPAMTGPVAPGVTKQGGGYGAAVMGWYGVGLIPRVEVQTVRRCPPGMALGKDGVCYDGLGRNSKKRAHPRGMKPLMTGGDRAAIARAARVARALDRSKKSLKKAGKALEKVC